MSNPKNESTNLYALLIGVDCYLPNSLPDGSYYGNLRGCVRDVSHVQAFLKRTFTMPQNHIFKLTATNTGDPEPPEPREHWPTYENMVAEFRKLRDTAQSGDLVYIHYSGHGGRASTIFPKLKGENGVDEGLVPTDIGDSEARYLRDVELAQLLNEMVDKGLLVAVVLDSCHSGGMTRGRGDVGVRGINSVDTTQRPRDSLVGSSHEELVEMWEHLTEGRTRDVKLGSGWLPEPKGYALLAACRPSESAYEYAFDGKERNGALTYWLLDSLQDVGPGLSYKVLHDRIVAKVHSQFENQTPQLQGEGDRQVFGSDRVQPHYAVPVMKVDEASKRLLLNAGQAQGLRKDAQFAVYPHTTTDFTDLEKRQALVEVSEIGATDSWATITEQSGRGEIEQGAQAVLLGAGSARLVRNVSLVHRDDLPASIDQQAALRAVQQALQGSGWIEVATDGKEIAYQVAVNELSKYEIWDSTGHVIKNLRPTLRIDDPHAAASLARRLAHLAKYNAVRQLNNHDQMSPLARKLIVELVGKRDEYDPADPFEPQLFEESGGTHALTVGEWTGLRIKNDSSRTLNITVFDLQPDWGATQILPSGAGDLFIEFDPGQEMLIPLRAHLPEGYQEGTDVIKVFATIGTTNFRWLELPSLDEPLKRSAAVSTKSPAKPLEQLLAAITADKPIMRDLIPAAYPSKGWITAQVEVCVKKADQG
jgi:hypothetical protein